MSPLFEALTQIQPQMVENDSFLPGLFGVAFAVAFLMVLTRFIRILSSQTMKHSFELKKLVPSSGAHLWWSLFQNSPTIKGNKAKLKRELTSIGRFALRSQTRRNPCIVSFFVALSNKKGSRELSGEELGTLMQSRVLKRHDRFRSRVDPNDDRYFEEIDTQNMSNFVTETSHPSDTDAFVSHISEYCTSEIEVNRRLWEAQVSTGPIGATGAIPTEVLSHLAPEYDRETVALFRVHHALCDGVSLSIAIGDLCDEGEELHSAVEDLAKKRKVQQKQQQKTLFHRAICFLKLFWFYVVLAAVAIWLQIWRSMIAVNPFDQVVDFNDDDIFGRSSIWRYVAPTKEVKEVAKTISKTATLNDVFVACVSTAFYKQLDEHKKRMEASGRKFRIPNRINITVPAHLTGGILQEGQSLGNKIGAFVSSIPRQGNKTSAEWLKQVSRALRLGKTTPASLVAWILAKIMSYGPLSWVKWALRNGHAKSVAVISNIRGFPFTTHWNGRRLEFLSAFLPLPPGIPIGIVVQSYDGNMSFTVEAEKRVIPDARKFADWVIEEYETLKSEANRFSLHK